MQQLNLDTSTKAFLQNTSPDPNNPGKTLTYVCDLKGKALAVGAAPIPVYRDVYTGDVYVRVAEVIPTANDATSQATAAAIQALKPLHFCSPNGDVKGYFVRVGAFDDYNEPPAAG